jgi:hypothetical protein
MRRVLILAALLLTLGCGGEDSPAAPGGANDQLDRVLHDLARHPAEARAFLAGSDEGTHGLDDLPADNRASWLLTGADADPGEVGEVLVAATGPHAGDSPEQRAVVDDIGRAALDGVDPGFAGALGEVAVNQLTYLLDQLGSEGAGAAALLVATACRDEAICDALHEAASTSSTEAVLEGGQPAGAAGTSYTRLMAALDVGTLARIDSDHDAGHEGDQAEEIRHAAEAAHTRIEAFGRRLHQGGVADAQDVTLEMLDVYDETLAEVSSTAETAWGVDIPVP